MTYIVLKSMQYSYDIDIPILYHVKDNIVFIMNISVPTVYIIFKIPYISNKIGRAHV